jgi:hypothetical protein
MKASTLPNISSFAVVTCNWIPNFSSKILFMLTFCFYYYRSIYFIYRRRVIFLFFIGHFTPLGNFIQDFIEQRGFATTGGSYACMHNHWIVGSCYSYHMRCRVQDYVGANGWKDFVCCMHMVLLKGYLGRLVRMARAGGDLGNAMRCCFVHLPNQVTYWTCHAMLPFW